MEVMAGIRSTSPVSDPIVNRFNHRLDGQETCIAAMEAKIPMPLLPPVFPVIDQPSTEMQPTLSSLITMETDTPPPQAEIVVVRVEQIKDVVAYVGELGLDPCADNGRTVASLSVSLTEGRWPASMLNSSMSETTRVMVATGRDGG
jgi:hypothetical protein